MADLPKIELPKALDANELTKRYKSRHAALKDDYQPMLSLHRDIRDFLAPRTARFDGEQETARRSREDLNIINTKPRFAVRTLPGGLQSGVTSPLRPWFRLGTPDPELQNYGPVKEYLYIVERRMLEVMSRSNIYDRLKSNYGSLGTYGTSCFFVDEDQEDIIRAHDFLIGTFYLQTSAAGRVTSMYRNCMMTVAQQVEKFKGRVAPAVKTNYDNGNYDIKYPIIHVIEPNHLFLPENMLSERKLVSSAFFDPSRAGEEAILKFDGYDYNPLMGPRWDVVGDDVWGVGCGETAIGDGKQTQLMEKRKLQGIDKNVNPTMVADASLRNQRLTNLPGDTTFVNGLVSGKDGYKPAYQVNPYIQELREEINATTDRIDEAFYKNLFLMVTQIADQPDITATQINALREEKLLMLGPVLERLNDELLDPLIDAVFNIMQKRGMFPPPPPELQGMPLRVEYVSVLAQAQKAMGIGNIERFVGFVQNLSAVYPQALHKIKVNETIDAYADGTGVPPTLVATNEEADAASQQEAQQAQAAQAAQMGLAATEAAKNLSQSDMQGDNALTRAMQVANVGA